MAHFASLVEDIDGSDSGYRTLIGWLARWLAGWLVGWLVTAISDDWLIAQHINNRRYVRDAEILSVNPYDGRIINGWICKQQN